MLTAGYVVGGGAVVAWLVVAAVAIRRIQRQPLVRRGRRQRRLPTRRPLPLELITTPRPLLSPPRNRYVYYPGVADVPESQAANTRNRSYSIAALVDIPAPGTQGVLFAHGSRFGGHALYVKDNRLHYVYSFVGN